MHDLIESVRSLGLKLTGKPSPACVRVAGDPKSFPDRLQTVQEALEALDASAAHGSHDGPDTPELSPKDDPEKLKQALDSLLRFVQASGADLDAAVDVVAKALELDGKAKKKKGYITLPKFAPDGFKKKKNFKPKLQFFDHKAIGSLETLRKRAFDTSITAGILGATTGRETSQDRKRIEEMKAETSGEVARPAFKGPGS